ncbi:MAG: S1 family peptidase [Candidatus Nealsonbacteria bacterium]
MNKIKICKKVKERIRHLILFDGNQVVSSGTGVIIKESGELLTANHVIAGYPELAQPRIIANAIGDIAQTEYSPLLFNISFDIGMAEYAKLLVIDLAILKPVQEIKKVSFMKLGDSIPPEGEEIIMAGFPDEIKPPLNFDKILNFDNPELGKQKAQIDNFFKHFLALVMIKSGMVGSIQKVKLNSTKIDIEGFNNKEINVEGAVYWIDNASTYGASGGPVINSSGELIGIISEKGMTEHLDASFPSAKIPSGSTMALSHKLITWFFHK